MKFDNRNIGHTRNSWMISIWKRNFTYKYIILEIFYDCECPLIIFQTWSNKLKLDKEDNVMSYVWVYLHRSYIVMDPPTCGACLESFASQIFCTSREYCLCIQNPWAKFLPWVSTIPTYMRYYSAVPSKFACATSNHSNKHLFCVPVPLMKR